MQSQFCASFYLVAGGGILFYNGVVIGSLSDSLLRFEAGRFTITEFVGCLAGVTFAVSIIIISQQRLRVYACYNPHCTHAY